MKLPRIIQGGMGIGISGWKLASAVASCGQLGVISGICLDQIMVRRLQIGDPGGHVRRALSHFPIKEIASRIIDTFFKDKGKGATQPFMTLPPQGPEMSVEREDLIVAGSFAEMFLAKEGHKGIVGVNLMEKIQTDCLPTLYGCMLAGVDYVIVGAGIPRQIPGILDKLSTNMITSLKLTVTNALASDSFNCIFDPSRFKINYNLKRPKFLAIIASHILGMSLMKKPTGKIDGFVVEGNLAGGHNATSRSSKELSESGEPIYGERDEIDLDKIKNLGVPFWLAGGYCLSGKLKEALELGAQGIQTGTPFSLCEESGLTPELKKRVFASDREVFTDPNASPTGFPFKVIQLDGTLSDRKLYEERPRVCNLGYLRERYRKEDGTMGTRCPAEPVNAYVAKGGDIKDTVNSKCLCNALFSNIGLPNSYRNGYVEYPLITAGAKLNELEYMYLGITAKEVIAHLLSSSGLDS